jgi:hypothetical protein
LCCILKRWRVWSHFSEDMISSDSHQFVNDLFLSAWRSSQVWILMFLAAFEETWIELLKWWNGRTTVTRQISDQSNPCTMLAVSLQINHHFVESPFHSRDISSLKHKLGPNWIWKPSVNLDIGIMGSRTWRFLAMQAKRQRHEKSWPFDSCFIS